MILAHCRNTTKPALFPQGAQALRLWDGGTRMGLLNPSAGTYNFAQLDAHLAATPAGIDSIYVFGSTPSWAAVPTTTSVGGAYDPTSNYPMDLAALADFVDALMAHVGTRIKYFETWNEWNALGFYCGGLDHLAAQQNVIYTRVKKANPAALVTTPTPCWNPTNQYPTSDLAMDAFLGTDAPFDIVTFHGYIPNGSAATQVEATILNLQAVLAKRGVTAPLWDTEYGPNTPANIAADQQRLWVFDSLLTRERHGLALACWYQWDNQTHGTCTDLLGNLTTYGQAWADYYAAQVTAN